MVYELLDHNEEVVILDNLSTGQRWLIPERVPLITGSTGDAALVRDLLATHRIETIIHFAASIVVPESVADPLRYYENNTANSRTLLDAAVRGGVKHFIFSSTAAVYGEPGDGPVGEDVQPAPTSPYGTSKWMTEMMLRDVGAVTDLRFVALRYFNVAGADPALRTGQATPKATHLIKVAAQAALGKRPYMEVFGTDYPTRDGTCLRDYIHVSDLVAAHRAALTYLREGGKSTILNCGYGHGYSVRDVIDVVKRVAGVDFEVREAPRRPGDPAQIVASADRIRQVLGWKPARDDLPQIVKHALAWEEKLAARA
jgi:UDP-glucose 4-epimerase